MEKILVIQTAFIGDAILTLPMIQKLKELYPLSEIDIIAIPSTNLIFSSSPVIKNVHVLDKRGKHKNIVSFLGFCRNIRKNSYSRIYSPHRSFRSSLIVMLSGVKETYGFTKNSLKQVYKHLVEYNSTWHEVQRNLSLIGADISGDNWKIIPQLSVSEESESKAARFITGLGTDKSIITIAPGSVWNTKKYPLEYFKQVIEQLIRLNYFVVLLGGKEDADLCQDLEGSGNDSIRSAAGMLTVTESVQFLKSCKLIISNDSAPSHMGVSAGIPVLTLYCSTVAGFGFYPYNSGSAWLSYDDLYCKPCGIHGYNECPVKTFDCGYNLKPLQVIKKIEEMINESQRG